MSSRSTANEDVTVLSVMITINIFIKNERLSHAKIVIFRMFLYVLPVNIILQPFNIRI